MKAGYGHACKAVHLALSIQSHIRIASGDALLRQLDVTGDLLQQPVLNGVSGGQIVGFQELQLGYLDLQIHLLLNGGIPGGQGLDFRIGQRRLVHILAGSGRTFTGHDLPDKSLLVLHRLPHIAVEGVLGHIPEDLHLRVVVALPQDAALPLLYV